jgi:hypothetical protein
MVVYVLLFNARTDNEGIHAESLQGQNVILMFEQEDDATRYALLLEAQDFPEATVEGFDQAEIEAFCEASGYEARRVPAGALAVPPDENLEETTWNPDDSASSAAGSDAAAGLSQTDLDRVRQQLENLL